MYGQRRSSPSILLAALALAWGSPSLAVEPEQATRAAGAGEYIDHTVAPGETISEIALRYGVRPEQLIRANGIKDVRKIWAGARLRIPAPASASRNPKSDLAIAPDVPAATHAPTVTALDARPHPATGAASPLLSEPAPVTSELARVTSERAALLERCEAEVRAAHFEEALSSASELRDRLGARDGADAASDRVRLEVATATAQLALGQHDEAVDSLERALLADPDLDLDSELTSPRLRAVFRAARNRAASVD